MKLVQTVSIAALIVLAGQAVSFAQGDLGYTPQDADEAARIAYAASEKSSFFDVRAIGVGLVIIGAGVGIGWLTRSAVESMARQPETAGDVRTAMIISAALIEGVTFFALIIIGFILAAY